MHPRDTRHRSPLLLLCFALLGSPASAQDPIPPPPQEPPPDEQPTALVLAYRNLHAGLDQLLEDGALKKGEHTHLRTPLERSQTLVYGADPAGAFAELETFEERVAGFVQRGVIDPKDGDGLRGQSALLRKDLLPFFEPPPLEPGCSGQFAVAYVDDSAPPGGDGSAAFPFNQPGEALAAAEAVGVPAVELRLARGSYTGHLEITRHTRIVGRPDPVGFLPPVLAGSVRNTGPFCLEIEGLAITDLAEGPAGALHVIHPGARTALDHVLLVGAQGYGLLQHGGTLLMEACGVLGTTPLAEPIGVAMHLGGGVQARLQNVRLTGNEGGGLVVAGPGTDVEALQLLIEGTSINGYTTDARPQSLAEQLFLLEFRLPEDVDPRLTATPGRAALHVRGGARFTGRGVTVRDNEYAGVYVENEAVADFDIAYVGRTRGVPRLCEGRLRGSCPDYGGMNVWSRANGRITMRHFMIDDAETCGVVVGQDGFVDLRYGIILRNNIALCIHDPAFDILTHIREGIVFRDNRERLDARGTGILPPAPSDGIDD